MDGHRVAEALGELVGHAHGKDTVFHADNLALNGLLDRRWPEPADQMPWTFAIPGRGHDLAWWTGLVRALRGSRAQVVSIQHRGPVQRRPPQTGVPEAARFLRAAIDGGPRPPSTKERAAPAARRAGRAPELIAQVMHLHYLAELAEEFEVAAVADIAPGAAPGRAPSGTGSPRRSPTGREPSEAPA